MSTTIRPLEVESMATYFLLVSLTRMISDIVSLDIHQDLTLFAWLAKISLILMQSAWDLKAGEDCFPVKLLRLRMKNNCDIDFRHIAGRLDCWDLVRDEASLGMGIYIGSEHFRRTSTTPRQHHSRFGQVSYGLSPS
jgi:hypothetical protein